MKRKNLEVIFTLFLLGILLYTRLTIRASNSLWIDEINEISHLKSLHYLIYEYLPSIPSGVLGHYVMLLPLNIFFPGNKFILGLPGLISNLLVFLLIPTVISRFNITSKNETKIASLIARVCFVFDPRLAFQSMEIRPYSLLPILWILSLMLVTKIISYDDEHNKCLKNKNTFLLVMAVIFLWIWHIYGLVMFILTYLFFILKTKLSKNIINLHYKSFMVICISLFLFLPIWIYSAKGSAISHLDTFEFFKNSTQAVNAAINQGYIKGITWQNYIYFSLIVFFLITIIWAVFTKGSLYLSQFLKILAFLVLMPVLTIFLLDFTSEYWFLYRQFAWVALPFYIAVGILVSGFRFKMLE
jgi:hypothetical protein